MATVHTARPGTAGAVATLDEVAEHARQIRIRILRMVTKAKSSHLGTAYSMADLMAVLYFRALRVDPANPRLPERDRFILSKAHGAVCLYATLAERGFLPPETIDGYYVDGGALAGHADSHGVPGVEVSGGALGHGLAIGVGMALAARHDRASHRVFVLMGDGECNEGSVWEAALAASSFGLDNLIAAIDYNKQQGLGRVEKIVRLEPMADKWRAFGWDAIEIDGHDLEHVDEAFARAPLTPGRPTVVVAHTIKGRGVSFMEDHLLWHYRTPDPGEYERALAELQAGGRR